MSDLMLDVGQAVELKEAFRRGNWTNAEIKKLCEGDRLEEVLKVLHGTAEIKLIKLLARVATIDLPTRNRPFNPQDYFQNKDGLCVWEGLMQRVIFTDKLIPSTSATQVTSFDLLRNAADRGIQAALPEGHVFSGNSVFCSHLAGLIDRQAGGKNGPLLNNGHTNNFYVKVGDRVVVVRVSWLSSSRRWRVLAYVREAVTWDAGSRVFSAAAVA